MAPVGEACSTEVQCLSLPSLQHPAVASLLNAHQDLVVELADGLGSPLHIVLPEVFEENISRLRGIFADVGADVEILFAKKANKANCFSRSVADCGVGIDVASTEELLGALKGGVPGDRIGISGPEKDDNLHNQAVAHNCLVAIDSVSELRRLAATARRQRRQVRVLLRSRATSQPNSRFGMADDERIAAVGECLKLSAHIDFRGFSFHLSGYSPEQRAIAANEMINHCLDARSRGATSADVVDIGGGLPMRYVEPEDWDDFIARNSPDHYHPTKMDRGFYCYPYGGLPTTDAARILMTHPVEGNEGIAARASRHGMRFLIEPGRSLLDQCGFSVFRVRQIEDRRHSHGYSILTVAGTSLNLCEQWFNTDYLPDPIVLPADPGRTNEVFPACVAGSTCLENDMVTWRKIGFPHRIQPGDHLVYLNTAGYHSDFIESRFHDTTLPLKVEIRAGDTADAPRWRLDQIG